MRHEVPSTVARSEDKAVRTYKKTLESAEQTYGDGERAHRTAFASLKHTYEKVGDHWERKEHKGPSDLQAAQGAPAAQERPRPTAQGVDANASKGHLEAVARKVGIEDPADLARDDLVRAIEKANARATARARKR
ncbi:ChaB family protein [Micromonospora soli]|uniref:ChaB family protein n=1 Tax=Micromonospora sp. NBRC 110009 TaxID=3061627 RepID=UPI0026726DCB|nr:ChaB family protein [Micromonospora sp. NBRC 110009]WKU02321.1 ChaB family protein [Micromonospora sp. NBRC 110009]